MQLLNMDQLRARLPLSRTKINNMIARGEFIQPLQVAGQLMFYEEELLDWMLRQPRGLYPQDPGLRRHQEQRKTTKGGEG